MAKAIKLKLNGETCFPVSLTKLIVDETDNKQLSQILTESETKVNSLESNVVNISATISAHSINVSHVEIDVQNLKNSAISLDTRVVGVENSLVDAGQKINGNTNSINRISGVTSLISDNLDSLCASTITTFDEISDRVTNNTNEINTLKDSVGNFNIIGCEEIDVDWTQTETQNDINLSINDNSINGSKIKDKTITLSKIKDFYIDTVNNLLVIGDIKYQLTRLDDDVVVPQVFSYTTPEITISKDSNGNILFNISQSKVDGVGTVIETYGTNGTVSNVNTNEMVLTPTWVTNECNAFGIVSGTSSNYVSYMIATNEALQHEHTHTAILQFTVVMNGVSGTSNQLTYTQDAYVVIPTPNLTTNAYYGATSSTPTTSSEVLAGTVVDITDLNTTTFTVPSGYKCEWISIPSTYQVTSWIDDSLNQDKSYREGETIMINGVNYVIYYSSTAVAQKVSSIVTITKITNN